MFISINKLANQLLKDKLDNRAAKKSDNKAFRATVSYLIVRDLAHEKVFAKALESLGVNWDDQFTASYPFGDGDVEALDGLPEGFDIPQMPESAHEYSIGLDSELKQKAESKQSE